MKYVILTLGSRGRLQSLVKQYLDDGWEPCGGPVAVAVKRAGSMDIGYEWSQAVTKKE